MNAADGAGKRRVLLVQPSLQPPGGGNGVAAWVLQALVPTHRVTVLSWRPVDINPINRFFGTTLAPKDFDTIVVPRTWRAIPDRLPVPATLIKLSLLMRYTRKISNGHDVLFGVYNETDFGRRGIQYIHYPTYLRPRPEVDLRWYHHPPGGLNLYYRLADWIGDFSVERMKQNVTLVNSDWTGTHVTRFLGVPTQTLYPPVADPAPELPWSDRRNGFLIIGRISPEKEYERVMRILARVREQIAGITLTIVGTWDRHARSYRERIVDLARSLGSTSAQSASADKSWIDFRDNISRDEMRRLMAAHRYGIHGMREEHFGMAPAELARAGCIVWVPQGGGQMEIVDREPSLMYDTEDDAVNKIVRTLNDPAEQERLRCTLRSSAERFSTAHFVERVRAIVNDFQES
ncbi:MAG TPA: glycosyltransferase [Vicinamibacterales bacterium]|nr:glycosyltransferase [Vicinamibacterales bacterium]